jgi:osmotically-inducible protein OsmY
MPLRRHTARALLLAAAILSSGCTAIVTEVAQKAWEDRTTETQVTDVKIHTRILQFLTDIDGQLPIDVNTDVWRRRILFTGTIDSAALSRRIEKHARADTRTRAVYNHIRIVSKREKEQRRKRQSTGASAKEKTGQIVSDAWIGAKIKVRLLASGDIKSVNYRWQSILGHVYIIGHATTRAERGLVLGILRTTKGVQSVTSHIEIVSR